MRTLFFAIACVGLFPCFAVQAKSNSAQQEPFLRFDISLGKGIGNGYTNVNGARFSVDIVDGGKTERLWSTVYGRLDRWYPARINLSRFAGRSVKIRLVAQHIDNRICQDYPFWGDPRVVLQSSTDPGKERSPDRLALRDVDRAGVLLPGGTISLLEDTPRYFGVQGVPLVVRARCSLKYNAMIYGGTSYITVGGRNLPGLYTGFDMSHGFGAFEMPEKERLDFLKKYRGGVKYAPNVGVDPAEPYVGTLPPPVFAEWTVKVPAPQPTSNSSSDQSRADLPTTAIALHDPVIIRSVFERAPLSRREAKGGFQWSPAVLSASLAAGSESDRAVSARAVSAVELSGLSVLKLGLKRAGGDAKPLPGRFAGLVLDFRTTKGYMMRYYLGDNASASAPDDLRVASYNLTDGAFSVQRLLQSIKFAKLSSFYTGAGRVEIPLTKLAPEGWDGHIWLGAALVNTRQAARLAVNIDNAFSGQNAVASKKPAVITNGRYSLAVSSDTGAVSGFSQGNQKILASSNDLYQLRRLYMTEQADERLDKLVATRSWKEEDATILQADCRNKALPGLDIQKTYALSAHGALSKKVAFRFRNGGECFVSWNNVMQADAGFLQNTVWNTGIGAASRVAQGKVIEADAAGAVPAEQAGLYEPAFYFNAKKNLSIGAYRWKVNGRYAQFGPAKKLASGWDIFGAQGWLGGAGDSLSAEVRVKAGPGNYFEFFEGYNNQPEVRAVNADLPVPNWLKYLVCDGMYYSVEGDAMAKLLAPYTTTSSIWFLNSAWGNWGAVHFDPAKNGKHHNVFAIAREAEKVAPLSKVSAYHAFLFDEGSDFFKRGGDVGVRDQEGSLIASGVSSDSTRGPAYFLQVGDKSVRDELVRMHVERMKQWGFGYLYFDGPGYAAEVPDWSKKRVAQSYDWIEYLKRTGLGIKEWDSDAIIFSNGLMPYSQVGYVEFRNAQWQQLQSERWRPIAAQLLKLKATEPDNFTWVPTYGHQEADPMLAAYTLMYGWAGNLPTPSRFPWMLASWEMRWSRLQTNSVSPSWINDPSIQFEAYGSYKKNAGIVSVIDHDQTRTKPFTIGVDAAKLRLDPSRPIRIWDFQMLAPAKPIAVEQQQASSQEELQRMLNNPPVKGRFQGEASAAAGRLQFSLKPEGGLPLLRLLSNLPVVLKEVGGVPLRMGLPCHPDVDLAWSKDQAGERIIAVAKKSCTLAMPKALAARFEVTGAKTIEGDWLGNPSLLIEIPAGRSEVVFSAK